MNWLSSFWIVLAKELREGLRDRKALTTALFFPVLGPPRHEVVDHVVEHCIVFHIISSQV